VTGLIVLVRVVQSQFGSSRGGWNRAESNLVDMDQEGSH
jgi:hypothetical protein